MRTVIDEAIVALNLEDNLSEPMARAVEEARAEAEALGHIRAKIKVDAETAKARADLAELKAQVKDLSGEEKKAARERIKFMEEELRERQRISTVSGLLSRQANDLLKQKTNLEKETASAVRDTARAEDEGRTAALRRAREIEKTIETQNRYIKSQERLNALRKAESRAQGSEKQRVQFDSARTLAEMARIREELKLMNADPIDIKVNVDERGAGRVRSAINSFTGANRTNQLRDLAGDTRGLGKAFSDTNVNIGAFSTSLRTLLIGASALAPIVTGLVGTLGALISVAGAGIGGALGVGSAAMTGFGVAALGIFTSVKPVITSLTQAHKATVTYNAAIAKYGENSKQGQKATQVYHNQLKAMPPLTRQIVTGFGDLRKEWQKATSAVAQRDIGNIVGASFKTIHADMRFFSRDTNSAFNSIASGWSNLMKNLRDPAGGGGALSNIFGNFDKALPSILDGLNHLVDVWLRVTSSFSNYLPSLARGFDAWAKALDDSAKRSNGFEDGVGKMVGSLQDIGHLLQSATRFLMAFFGAGVDPGRKMVEKLTGSLDDLNDRISTTSGQERLTNFFSRSISLTSDLFKAVGPLASAFVSWSQAMQPIAAVALKLVTVFTKFVAVIARIPILSDVLGGALAIAVIGRMTSALFEMGTVAGSVGTKLARAFGIWRAGGGGLSSIGPSLREAFTGGSNSTVAAFEKGSAITEEAIISGFTKGSGIMRGEMVTGGAEAGSEIAAEERAGAVGGVGGRGAGAAEGEAGAAGGIGSKFARAGVIGIGGLLAAQTIGSTVGGKTGSAISNIGSLAAGGAAAGSFAGLPGAFGGAILGGIIGAFATFVHKDAGDFGKQIADKITGPMRKDVRNAFRAPLARDFTNINRDRQLPATRNVEQRAGVRFGVPDVGARTRGGMSPEERARLNADQAKAGRDAAHAFERDYAKTKLKSEPAFLADIRHTISNPNLGRQGRIQGAFTALQFASGLEHNKELPKNATKRMINALEHEVPGLTQFMRQQGLNSSRALGQAMNFKNAENKMINTVSNLKGYLDDYRLHAKTTGQNVSDQQKIEMDDLRSIMRHGTRDQVRIAKNAYDDIVQNTKDSLDKGLTAVKTRAAAMEGAIKTHTKGAKQAAIDNFAKFQNAVYDGMRSGALSSTEGSKKITQALNATLKALGVTQVPVTTVDPTIPKTARQKSVGGAARGHLMQVGRPGEAGQDTVPMSVAGQNIVVAPGEQVAVVNRHQQQFLNSRLSDVGGFTGMFNKITRPNYMAGGGVVGSTGFTTVTASAEDLGGSGYKSNPISAYGYSELGVPPTHENIGTALGRLPYLTRMRIRSGSHEVVAAKQDIGTGSSFNPRMGIYPGTRAQLGLSGGQFTVSIERADGQPLTVGSGVGASVSAAFKEIKAPHVHGKGTIAREVRAALAKEAKAANAYERAHMPKPVVGGGPGGASTFAGKGNYSMYRWPVPDGAPFNPGRIDRGQDFETSPHGTFNAIGNAVVTSGATDFPGITYRLLEGPAAGMQVFDGHTYKSMVRAGQRITAGQPIGLVGHQGESYDGGVTHLELGFLTRAGAVAPAENKDTHYAYTGQQMHDLLEHIKHFARGGMLGAKYAGEFAEGGAFTTNGPTYGMFGENGPETVIAIPHYASGTSNAAKPKKTTTVHNYLTGPYAGRYLPIVDPNTGRIPRNPYRNLHGNRHHGPIHPLLPRDRIGDIGAEDLDNAVNAAHVAYNAYAAKLRGKKDSIKEPTTSTSTHTDRHGHRTTTTHHGSRRRSVDHRPTRAERHHLDMLRRKWHSYQELDDTAHARINSFANIESAIGDVGQYLGIAGSHPSDTAEGFEPRITTDRHGVVSVALTNRPVTRTWDQWKSILDKLTREHVKELRVAATEVREKVGRWKDATSIEYVGKIQAAYGQAIIDQQSEADMTDPNDPTVATYDTAASADDYAQIRGLTDKFALDNYISSLAQGNNVPDQPGTPQREDLESLNDDLAAAKTLMDDYGGLLMAAQNDPKVNKNYPLMTSISDAFNSARQSYQSIQDQFTQAAQASGPSNAEMAGTALTSLYSQYGGNAANVLLGGGGSSQVAAGPAISAALAGGVDAGRILAAKEDRYGPGSVTATGQPTQPAAGHTVNNYFSHPPADPHTWSKNMLWELNA